MIQKVLSKVPYFVLLVLFVVACAPAVETPVAPTPTTMPPPATPTATLPAGPVDPTAPWTAENIFQTILGPAPAPEGWRVQPCQGQAPYLCVFDGEEAVGSVELLVSPLDNYTDLQAILEAQGVMPGTVLQPDEARAALSVLAQQHLDIIEADRQLTYPDDAFLPFGPEPVEVGDLPGVTVGFRRENAAGEVEERYLNYVAFDGRILYWLGVPYDPENVTTFISDEALLEFEPHLRQIVAGLALPPPVAETEATTVTVVAANVFLSTLYGEHILEEAVQRTPYTVIGASQDGRWWQVECPQFLIGVCWLPADPQRVQ